MKFSSLFWKSTIPFRLLFLSILPLAIAACASSTPGTSPQAAATQQAAGSFQPQSGTAGLYVFKEETLVNVTESTSIFVDGRVLGMVASNAYLYQPLTPGLHTVEAGASQVKLTAVAGQNYFIRQTPKIDSSGALVSSSIALEPQASGLQIVKRIQLENFSN